MRTDRAAREALAIPNYFSATLPGCSLSRSRQAYAEQQCRRVVLSSLFAIPGPITLYTLYNERAA
jgi:hypothetical protein